MQVIAVANQKQNDCGRQKNVRLNDLVSGGSR